jgi:hypothetical protein
VLTLLGLVGAIDLGDPHVLEAHEKDQIMSEVKKLSHKPTIVLVHGAFADSSSWNDVISTLAAHGFPVFAAANLLRGVAYDVAALRFMAERAMPRDMIEISGPLTWSAFRPPTRWASACCGRPGTTARRQQVGVMWPRPGFPGRRCSQHVQYRGVAGAAQARLPAAPPAN